KALEMPKLRDTSLRDLVSYGYGGSSASHQLDDLRAWIQRLDIDADPAITRDTLRTEVRAIIGKADVDVTLDDIKRLSLLNDITGAKSLEMPATRDYSLRDLVTYGYGGSNATRQLDELRAWTRRLDIDADASITRDTLRADVRSLLAKDNADITTDDIKRLSLLNDITGAKSLEMPKVRDYTLRDLVSYGYGGSNASAQLDDLRSWIQRLDIDADPAITADTLRSEVRTIIDKADADVTASDMRRLAFLNDVTGAKALGMPRLHDYQLRDLAGWNYAGTSASQALDELRTWSARAEIEHDPAITAKSLLDEVTAIAVKPLDELTSDDMMRLHVLSGMESAKAPGLPTLDYRSMSRTGVSSETQIDQLRTWAYTNSPEGLSALAMRLRAGETVGVETLRLVTGRSDELARLGIDRTSILSAAVRALRDKAETGAADQLAEIELVRAELASLTLTEPRAVQLRDTTLELVRDNVARMQGQKHDGYSRYPEFGEIGRIASNGELLGEIVRRSAPATSVAAPIPSAAGAGAATDAVATDAATGADLLTW
ncbi:MAG: hypothetical protein JWL76_1130, partial [Thermoleophilia bacterium]|nr:hypothetical protein [Thermoleophilia bacterium]